MQQPLAYRMRPRNLDEVVGQQHLVDPERSFAGWLRPRCSSMILYGPPGTGKTKVSLVQSPVRHVTHSAC